MRPGPAPTRDAGRWLNTIWGSVPNNLSPTDYENINLTRNEVSA